MIKFEKPRISIYELKREILLIDLEFLAFTFSIMYDSFFELHNLLEPKISNFYKKLVSTKKKLGVNLKTEKNIFLEHKKSDKFLKLKNLKTKFINKVT
jgi:hypothetical protein